MIRRTFAVLTAAAGLAAVLSLPASAAQSVSSSAQDTAGATGTCTLSVPTRVAIGAPKLTLAARVTGTCAAPGHHSEWTLRQLTQKYFYRGMLVPADVNRPQYGVWTVLAKDPIGAQRWEPAGSLNADGTRNVQNQVNVTVKLAVGAWISASRHGDVVTLKGTSLLYSTSKNVYFRRAAAGEFQYRERGTTQWKGLKTVRTGSNGEATFSYRQNAARDYRFALYSTPISWDLASSVTTR